MYTSNGSYSLTTALSTTPEIPYSDSDYGTVYMPATTTAATLTFYGAEKDGGAFVALYNGGTAVTISPTQGRAYALPAQCAGCHSIKIVSDVAVTVVVSKKG